MQTINVPEIASRAMLASLKVTAGLGNRKDAEITAEVEARHNSRESGAWAKRLVAKSYLEPLRKVASEARAYHYAQTLPWAQDGARILPAASAADYLAKMGAFESQYKTAARELESVWPDVMADARARLNGMFRLDDYPAAGEVAELFTLSAAVLPLPTGDDFRVKLDSATVAAIRADIDAQTSAAVTSAMGDVWRRLFDAVNRMKDGLAAFKPEESGAARGTFRDSLVNNVRELADLLPRLNLTGDPNLAAMVAAVKADLTRVDAEELRTNPAERAKTAATAGSLAAKIQAMGAGYFGKPAASPAEAVTVA